MCRATCYFTTRLSHTLSFLSVSSGLRRVRHVRPTLRTLQSREKGEKRTTLFSTPFPLLLLLFLASCSRAPNILKERAPPRNLDNSRERHGNATFLCDVLPHFVTCMENITLQRFIMPEPVYIQERERAREGGEKN